MEAEWKGKKEDSNINGDGRKEEWWSEEEKKKRDGSFEEDDSMNPKKENRAKCDIRKCTQRLVVLAISIFILQMVVLELDIIRNTMVFVTRAYSYYEDVNDVTSFRNDTIYIQRICEQNISVLVNASSKSGRLVVNTTGVDMGTVVRLLAHTVNPGGRYSPPNCTSKQKVAIVVPYRDRDRQLRLFLRHMHPFLQQQQLEYEIFIIEMVRHVNFSRALLMNIGFVEAMKLDKFDCFVFHDVDLLPEDSRIPYSCADMPRHLSAAVDIFKYKLPYRAIFGGVCAITTQNFRKINGMSNMFFGWGGEDDDFRSRIYAKNLVVIRPSIQIARYKMVKHVKDSNINTERKCMLKSVKTRMPKDGLSSLKYKVREHKFLPLYTWILVKVNQTEQMIADPESFKIYKKCQQMSLNETIETAKKKEAALQGLFNVTV